MAELKKREKIMVGAAGGLLCIFFINQFVCGKKEAPSPPLTKKTVVEKEESVKPKLSAADNTVSRRGRKGWKEFMFASWGRDPFAQAFRLAKLDTTQNDSSDFVLRGVIWKGKEAHVLIGDIILKEGEQSGDLKILDIDKNQVVCKKGDKVVTLMMREDEN